MKPFLCASALGLILAASGPALALAEVPQGAAATVFASTTLDLSAYGETRAEPDMATISLGVTTSGPTAARAMADNASRMGAVVAALRKSGIPDKDIQTSGLNLSAQYAYEPNQTPKLTGYQASNQVTVTVHDLARLGPAVDATTSAGANQVNGISFGLDDPTAAENIAREAAVKALRAKADLYARATGYRVLRLVSLSEGGGYSPPGPLPMMSFAKRDATVSGTAVSPGELKVRIDINGLYELGH